MRSEVNYFIRCVRLFSYVCVTISLGVCDYFNSCLVLWLFKFLMFCNMCVCVFIICIYLHFLCSVYVLIFIVLFCSFLLFCVILMFCSVVVIVVLLFCVFLFLPVLV
jgi:hypothetical protein